VSRENFFLRDAGVFSINWPKYCHRAAAGPVARLGIPWSSQLIKVVPRAFAWQTSSDEFLNRARKPLPSRWWSRKNWSRR